MQSQVFKKLKTIWEARFSNEIPKPVKHVRGNKLHTIKNHIFESITCDDISAYIKYNNVKKTCDIRT